MSLDLPRRREPRAAGPEFVGRSDRPWRALTQYSEGMVNPALQSAIEAMSLDERWELVEYIESTVESEPIESDRGAEDDDPVPGR